MTITPTEDLNDGDPRLSFYLTNASHERGEGLDLARKAARLAGALTIAGPEGPGRIHRLRALGVTVPIYFDAEGYKRQNVPEPDEWVQTQRQVGGAVRALLPGVSLEWNDGEHQVLRRLIHEQGRLSEATDAVMLLAVDARIVGRQSQVLIASIQATERPVAIVLAYGGDPLSLAGAVEGLQRLALQLEDVMLLRTDHGGIGALAFGAGHASIGLRTSTRHLVTAKFSANKKQEKSSRVFVPELMDWFIARDIASWRVAGLAFPCYLACCEGLTLDRFFDPDIDATPHNMHALEELARSVLGVNEIDRPKQFTNMCRTATQHYGPGSIRNLYKPKRQLTSWALS